MTWSFESVSLIVTILKTFQGETILDIYAWADSKFSLAWIRAINKKIKLLFKTESLKLEKMLVLKYETIAIPQLLLQICIHNKNTNH